jgi:hypothetical protein
MKKLPCSPLWGHSSVKIALLFLLHPGAMKKHTLFLRMIATTFLVLSAHATKKEMFHLCGFHMQVSVVCACAAATEQAVGLPPPWPLGETGKTQDILRKEKHDK